MYDKVIKQCDICEKAKPVPQRSKVSGMRTEVFGDLLFADYGEFKINGKIVSSSC